MGADELKRIITNIKWKFKKTKNNWPQEKLISGAMKQYQHYQGYVFDINNPILFTEKIVWYKLFYNKPNLINIVDKFLFKQYIKEKLGEGYTIPLYGVWSSIDLLKRDWEKLPREFVLKSTLQSDGKFIKVIHDKNSVDLSVLLKELREWLEPRKTLIHSFCRAYYKGVPRILAEKYMAQVDNQLYDYKVFCFNGRPCYNYVATDHFPGQLSHISFYDLAWNKLDVHYGKHPNCDVAPPKHYKEMLKISEKLSREFPFIRIDFFEADKLYLAEMTLYPGGGTSPIYPKSFNKEMGDLFVLPKSN